MDKLLKKLNIDETYTRKVKIPKLFNKVKDNIPHIEDYNFMADILMLPETNKGYKYLLVLVDLATNEFDIEPMKNKDNNTVLRAMKQMFKRPHIKKPYASIRTYAGEEFKGKFAKYLYNNSILHKIALPNRHKQMSNVENLNRTILRLFNGYMNEKEKETQKQYNEWDNVIDIVRTDLNAFRKIPAKDRFTDIYPVPDVVKPKYKVGDLVYYHLDYPEDALGKKQKTATFKEGDFIFKTIPTKVKQILYYSGKVPIRYMLEGIPNASYAEYELLPAIEKEEMFIVRKIIGQKILNKKLYYKVWWKNHLKKDSTWESKTDLIEYGLKDYIVEYEKTK